MLWALLACGVGSTEAPAPPPPAAAVSDAPSAPTWADELARLDHAIAATRTRAEEHGGWLVHGQLAGMLQQRARLTGSYEDLAQAEQALAEGFADAPAGSGPLLERAALNYTLHRFDRIEADLATFEKRVQLDDIQRATLHRMRGQTAFQQGRVDRAEQHLRAALALRDDGKIRAALAQLAAWRGDHEAAERELAVAESRYHGQWHEPRMWFHLQRGLWDLDRGRLDEALAHYADADRTLPGHWLVAEHRAEIHALRGEHEVALEIYEEVVASTGNPELMGALAGVLDELGRTDEAASWVTRATAAFEAQLERFPEAASGHALDHFLEHAPPQQALALARDNVRLRPNAEALTQLARAQLRAGDTDAARATLEEVIATGWASDEPRELLAALE